MDRPTLHPLAAELADSERLGAFADDLGGARARVSEPGCRCCSPRSTCARAGALVVLLPEDADARDAAEAAAWYLGDEQVALLPSRGVRWESGLEPPPHLVGERARALDVLAAGGLVCASAAALAELLPPPDAAAGAARARASATSRASTGSPSSWRSPATSASSASRSAASSPSAAGSSTSSRPPAASRSGSSCSATRSRRSAPSRRSRSARSARSSDATVYPAAERRARPRRADARSTRSERAGVPDDLVPPLDRAPDLVFEPEEVARGLGGGAARRRSPLERRRAARPVPARPAARVRGAAARGRRARARRGRAGARVVRPRRPARRRRVPAPRRRAPHREPAPPLEVELARGRAASCPATPGLYFTVSPARRGFVWRDLGLVLLPDTQIFRKRAPRARRPPRPRAPVVRRPAHRRLRRPRGPRRREAARLRDEGGRGRHARLPLPRASAATTASTSRTSRSARSRATSAPTRRRPRSPSSAARPGCCSRAARASPCRSSPAS